jgi:hypothetical protein
MSGGGHVSAHGEGAPSMSYADLPCTCLTVEDGVQTGQYSFFPRAGCVPATSGVVLAVAHVPSPFA